MAAMTPEDFEALVRPLRRELAAHCYRMLGSLADAEDQVQETLLRAWRGIEAFTMADCSLVPALRYARELHPFDRHKNITAYFARAAERTTVKGVFEEVAPHVAMVA